MLLIRLLIISISLLFIHNGLHEDYNKMKSPFNILKGYIGIIVSVVLPNSIFIYIYMILISILFYIEINWMYINNK